MRLIDSSRVTYGSQISDRIWQDNNGQLIIRDAVLARCGSYNYLEKEILPNSDSCKIVQVYRTPEEVFHPASMASFENKPFCNDHPEEDVTPLNYKDLQVGFVRDIRRGSGEFIDCLIGDIVVTDPEVIELIKSGEKRELSLGYNTQIIKGEDGKYYMTKIRGNHLALVDDGRAGNATIIDTNTVKNIKGDKRMANKIVFKTSNRDSFINKLYDEDIVEIEEIEDDDDVVVEEATNVEPETPAVSEPEKEVKDDDTADTLARIESKLDKILAMMQPKEIVQDEELPVQEISEPAKEEEVVEPIVEETDEDITTDTTDEPKLYDADAEQAEEETVEQEESDVNDAATNLYSQFVTAKDSNNTKALADEINSAFVNRYKKFGGKN
jgi:hypothetical protein